MIICKLRYNPTRIGHRCENLNVRQPVSNSSEDRSERSIRSLLFSQRLFADFLTTAVRRFFSQKAARRFFSQQLFADFSHNSCLRIFPTTADRRFFSQQLFADFSYNSCSQIFSQQLFADFLTTAARRRAFWGWRARRPWWAACWRCSSWSCGGCWGRVGCKGRDTSVKIKEFFKGKVVYDFQPVDSFESKQSLESW